MSGPYSIVDYGLMTIDRGRMDPYLEALRRVVRPDSVVVDIGAGAGIFAVHACRFGARRVYAIEPDESIELARAIAAANGCGDRVQFFRQLSTDVQLPERVDVMISDLRGILPLYDHHLPAIIDARERFLEPGGAVIAERDTLWTALVSAPDIRGNHVTPWSRDQNGIDTSAGLRYALNFWSKGRVTPEQLVVEPKRWGTIDYRSITTPNVVGTVAWRVDRAVTADGLSVWFDSEIFEGLSLSNAPGAVHVYGMLFFPLREPIELSPGDAVDVTISAHLVDDDYDWGWETKVADCDGRLKATFRQHSFLGSLQSLDRLRLLEASFIPAVGEEAAIERAAIDAMDGRTTLGEIAARLAARFPARFPHTQDALKRVASIAGRLSPSVADESDRAGS